MSSIRIECSICSKLIYAHNIKSHSKTCGQESESDSCSFCRKKFCSSYYRKLHELSHNKNYVRQCLTCPECKTSFSAVSSLNNHKKKCSKLQERKKRIKTVVLEPLKRVAKVYVPKQNELIPKVVAADVVHLPDEDIAAVETITSEIQNQNKILFEADNEHRQKVITAAVPQQIYVTPNICSIKK